MTFYINIVTHEVHKHFCEFTKYPNITYLGEYNYPYEAVAAAKQKGYYKADGCAYCCPQSHTK